MSDAVPYLGIDFGKSKSCMAWFNPRTGQAEVIKNAEGEDKTPSVVHFGDGEVLVGTPAERLLQHEEERRRVLVSVKRDLARPTKFSLPGGRRVSPMDVAVEVFRKLKRDAEAGHFHEPVGRAVVTCPAAFSQLERDKVEQAARAAGFQEVRLLEEPAAAALAYARAGLKVGRTVLVYDLGGGTFDLALLVREEASDSFRLGLEPKGVARCGGDDFDWALYAYCDEAAHQALNRAISLDSGGDLGFLRECRLAKETLSLRESYQYHAYLPGGILFKHGLERTTFEGLIRPHLEQTVRLTRALVEEADRQQLAVETVVLIGGSSRVPLVAQLLKEALPVSPQEWQHRDMAVALGAAYHANDAWGVSRQPRPEPDGTPSAGPDAVEAEAISVQILRLKAEEARKGEQQEAEARRLAAENFQGLKRQVQAHFEQRQWHEASQKVEAILRIDPADGDGLVARRFLEQYGLPIGEIRRFEGTEGGITCMAFSPDGRSLFAGGEPSSSLGLWETDTGKRLLTIQNVASVTAVAFSPDGRAALSGGREEHSCLWDVTNGQFLRSLTELNHSRPLTGAMSCAFLRDSRQAVVKTARGFHVVDVATGNVIREFGHNYSRLGVVSADGLYALCDQLHYGEVWEWWGIIPTVKHGHKSSSLHLVEVSTGQPMRVNSAGGQDEYLFALAFSSDSSRALSGSCKGTIILWDVHHGLLPIRQLNGHTKYVFEVAFSPDGRLALSGGMDETMRLWDLGTGQELRCFKTSGTVTSVAFSPDGRRAVSGGLKGLQLWGLGV